jgi:hypothetical protein
VQGVTGATGNTGSTGATGPAGGGGVTLRDSGGAALGTVVGLATTNYSTISVLTSTFHLVKFRPEGGYQNDTNLLFASTDCTGQPYLASLNSTQLYPRFARTLVYAKNAGKFYVLGGADANGVVQAKTQLSLGINGTIQSAEDYSTGACIASSSPQTVFPLVETPLTSMGLPATISWPLQFSSP